MTVKEVEDILLAVEVEVLELWNCWHLLLEFGENPNFSGSKDRLLSLITQSKRK